MLKLTPCCNARVLVGWPHAWRRPAEGRVLCTYCGATLEQIAQVRR